MEEEDEREEGVREEGRSGRESVRQKRREERIFW